MRILSVLIAFLFIPIIGFAHGDGDGHDEGKNIGQYEYILPFIYLDNGEYFSAIIVIAFWIFLLRGIYILSMFVFGRLVHSK